MTKSLIAVILGVVAASAAVGSVVTTTTREAELRGEKVLATGTIARGERVDVVDRFGAWLVVRYTTSSGETRQGQAAIRAFARTGDTATAMRDTAVFGLTRPVLATIPASSTVELVRSVDDGYVVRFTPSGGTPVEGVVDPEVIPAKDQISILRSEVAQLRSETPSERGTAETMVRRPSVQTEPRSPVTVTLAAQTDVYAAEAKPIAQLEAGQHVEILDERGRWYVVRFAAASGETVEGLARTGAFARAGDDAQAMHATEVYAPERPVVATLDKDSPVEILAVVADGYRIAFTSADGKKAEGIVRASAALREQVARATAERDTEARVEPTSLLDALAMAAAMWEEETFEALYQTHKHNYAVVAGELVRLPPFDLDYDNSRGATPLPESERATVSEQQWRTELPAWQVGEFGRVGPLKVLRVVSPERMLCEYSAASGPGVVCLTGWSTKNVTEGQVWRGDIPGPQGAGNRGAAVAVVDTFTYTKAGGELGTVPEAIPMAQVRRGISRTDFERFVWHPAQAEAQAES